MRNAAKIMQKLNGTNVTTGNMMLTEFERNEISERNSKPSKDYGRN